MYSIYFLVLQNDKKNQLEGKLKDVRFRLSNQRREMEQTNQTRETRIAEITQLQQQLQVPDQHMRMFFLCEVCLPGWNLVCLLSFIDVLWSMQESQQWLGRLIPDKQNLSEQLKQVQQNSLHRESKLGFKCSLIKIE